MSKLSKKLSLFDGIALGIGSIMGSGVLFLPSYTYEIAGMGAPISWILTSLLCMPLIIVFKAMVSHIPDESGLEGWISLGIGPTIGSSVPLLFLGTVLLGMPSAAIIAGKYTTTLFNDAEYVGTVTAFMIVTSSCVANIAGLKISSGVQKFAATSLFLLATVLVSLSLPDSLKSYEYLPRNLDSSRIVFASVIAFWAFAGFENMSFLAGEFKNPKRDLPLSIAASLVICGLIYFGLTFTYSVLVGANKSDSLTGLTLLAAASPKPDLSQKVLVVFAVVAVFINFLAWIWGISRLVFSAARKQLLPSILGRLNESKNVPANAILFLGFSYILVLCVFHTFPRLMEIALNLVSVNFLFIYLLAVISYLRLEKGRLSRIVGLSLFVLCVSGLASTGLHLIYPLTIVLLSSILRRKKVSRA